MSRPENKRMQDFLKANGIEAVARYNFKGSMKHTWHLYGPEMRREFNPKWQKWTPELTEKLTSLGFRDFDGGVLGKYSGNGGLFSVSVRGHYEFLKEGVK